MGFWNKLGKIALQAAPYVAAPFTGGASLYAIPATQKLGEKWASSDAKKAAEKGLAPSKFDKYLGMASNVASLASGTGALGKFGSAAYSGVNAANNASKLGKAASTAKTLSGWQQKIKQGSQIASMAMGGSPYAGQANVTSSVPQGNQGGLGGWQGALASGIGDLMNSRNPSDQSAPQFTSGQQIPSNNRQAYGPVMPRGGYGYNQDPMNQLNQNSPNLAQSIFQGRQNAMRDQPFRSGYTTQVQGPDDTIFTQTQPPIYPQYQQPDQFSDSMTQWQTPIQNQARRRNPEEEYN